MFGDDTRILRDREFQLLLLANVPGTLGSALVSPLLDSLVEPFNTSVAETGLLMSVHTAPPILLIPVAGVSADRCGRQPVVVTSLFCFGLTGMAVALTTEFRVALALRFLQGVAYAGLVPTIITSVGDLYAGTEEATAQGLRFTSSGLSQSLFSTLSGLLVAVAWQYPFLLYGLCIPIAAVLAIAFEEPIGRGDHAEAASTGEDDSGDGQGSRPGGARPLLALATRPKVFAILLARAAPTIVWTGFLTYASVVVGRLIGGTTEQAGLLVGIGTLAYAGTASQVGRFASLFDSRFKPLFVANLALGVGLALVGIAPSI
jgi:MFS family permease